MAMEQISGFQNKLYEQTTPWLTFFTPTYNRRSTIGRCYESLKRMKLPTDESGRKVELEWIIVDDGSSDDTAALVRQWADEEIVPIRYIYQENSGKHVATNRAVELSRGEMMGILDSDDSLYPEAMQILYDGWFDIPADRRHEFKGVTARCSDPETKRIIGSALPSQPYYVSAQDLRFRDHVEGEMFGIIRLDVMREFPFPVFSERTSYCPESIVWFEMGNKYMESIIDKPVRRYFRDASNSITTARSVNRSAANYYLWKYEVNNIVGKYLFSSPKDMAKALVGISMDGFLTSRSVRNILGDVDKLSMKLLVTALMPFGFILSLLRK